MQTLGIWLLGLFVGAMLGGMLAHYFLDDAADVFTGLIGMCAFACARLSLAPSNNRAPMTWWRWLRTTG
jgi:hypothetical protein